MSMLLPAKKQGNKFLNPVPTSVGGAEIIFSFLWEYLTTKAELHPKKPIGPFHTDPKIFNTAPQNGLRITWLGHSTLFIEIDGKKILTDPVWSERVSFSTMFGPKRFFAPPLPLEDLPVPDVIILSHDHYDHLDKATIKKIASLPASFCCSIGVGQYLEEWGVAKNRITEMNWMDTVSPVAGLSITATPARHFSGRSLFSNFTTLWSSFVIKTAQHNIFFGADSGWFDGFAEIGERFGPFDLSMLEIGAYGKGWPDIHMGPASASKAHLALRSKLLLPIHWGTFSLGLHAWKEPIERLLILANEMDIKLILPTPGESVEITDKPYSSNWWDK
jgi:L-ascorbate metabolism protein UlaG (beta-lactamase superfamily)